MLNLQSVVAVTWCAKLLFIIELGEACMLLVHICLLCQCRRALSIVQSHLSSWEWNNKRLYYSTNPLIARQECFYSPDSQLMKGNGKAVTAMVLLALHTHCKPTKHFVGACKAKVMHWGAILVIFEGESPLQFTKCHCFSQKKEKR